MRAPADKFVLIWDFIPRLRRMFESWLIRQAEALRDEGIEFHVCFSGQPVDWFAQEFARVGGVAHVRESMRGRLDKEAAVALIRSLGRTGLGICFYPMLSPATLRLTRLSEVTGAMFIDQSSKPVPRRTGWKALAVRLRGQLGARCYRRIITVSDYNRDKLVHRLGVPAGRVERLYNGVDLARFEAPPTSDPLNGPILYVGQMEGYKGVPTLLSAYEELRRRRQDAPALKLAGGGALLDALRSQGVPPGVELLGLRNDAPDLMREARCIVIPSEWEEACAFAAIESMASGRPVVASNAGSLPELLAGKAAIFKKGDVQGLVEALERVLFGVTAAAAERDAKVLREHAFREFSFDRMVEAYQAPILDVCGRA
ncbi:MAG: glycosyltransferase family 4 protein [Verrucomicrobiales bacterium]|nr:glycosyltransferase family 4 protein [Verrucomicrobiales bacterium]